MPPRFEQQHEASVQSQMPFTGDNVLDADFSQDPQQASSNKPNTVPRSRPIRAPSISSGLLSSSYNQRNPIRSFAHRASHAGIDQPQFSSQGVRERTQELAAYALDAETYQEPGRNGSIAETDASSSRRTIPSDHDGRMSLESWDTDAIEQGSEPESPDTLIGNTSYADRRSSSAHQSRGRARQRSASADRQPAPPQVVVQDTEETPLLGKTRTSGMLSGGQKKDNRASVSSYRTRKGLGDAVINLISASRNRLQDTKGIILDPKNFTKEAAMQGASTSVRVASAVFLGLLLNLLDALSYGYILFPLGSPVFSQTGPDGISIFFLSCIVSQLCYSLGLSTFKGGVGSEMIEVVPFFHNMAYSILERMEGESPDAIIATTLTAYCLSSVVTGLIFLALGAFGLGNLVSFFPRHILIGCIGGVGFFLFVTGIEVSARLDGNLNYNLDTLRELFAQDTVHLWLIPLALAIVYLLLAKKIKSPFLLVAYFIGIFATFYIVVKCILRLDLQSVRSAGWMFEQPEAGVPFYRFYSYFKFGQIDIAALASTIPTMFALSFFGIIHVPINVPALGSAVKEDNLDVNRELIAHGVSNTLSGCVGSIQNYLVYANSIMFIENGGNSRAAGFLLAMATTAVWVAGPVLIGFIPVCLVGALIFLLGIELMQEALIDTFGKCHKLEYLTILAIVLIMGVYDFVVGIIIGIVLACLSYVVQSSRVPAVRAAYSGEVAESTVRRPRADRRYLNQVRNQIKVIKLSGFLFFGTIVSVEEYMRSLIEEKNSDINYIIVDFLHVTDVDFSSSEGFQRINRILNRKHIQMVLSGVSFSNNVGQALQNVGLLDEEKGDEGCPPPKVFEDLNTALEGCENTLLEEFYKHCHTVGTQGQRTPPQAIPGASGGNSSGVTSSSSAFNHAVDPDFASPRRNARLFAAQKTYREHGAHKPSFSDSERPSAPAMSSKWKNFGQPIKIILQTFEDVSTRNVDFWHTAAPYFEKKKLDQGTVLYSRGDEPNGFYILERGRFRAEYELEQGNFSEVILPGTTCGELPFFSETDRTGTVAAEEPSTAWLLTRERFKALEEEHPAIASELLKVGLKLTKERMDAITSYVLVIAS